MATKKSSAKKARPTRRVGAPLSEKNKKFLEQLNALSFVTPREKEVWRQQLKNSDRFKDAKKKPQLPTLAKYDLAAEKTPDFAKPQVHGSVYDKKSKRWTVVAGEYDMYELLDTLAFLCEKGKLNSRTWVVDVFRTREAWDNFIEELEAFESYRRLRDPWWFALNRLAEIYFNEEGFSNAGDIAEAVSEHARETGQEDRLV